MGSEPILDDVSVLELGTGISAAYCSKLLAGLGAHVLKLERPGGAEDRLEPPFAGDTADRERSGSFLYLNTAKQSITLDLAQPEGQAIFRRLALRSDVIVESLPPGTLNAWGLAYPALTAQHPGLILASITPFGQDGPYRDYLINELVSEAVGGLLQTIGLPERGPLKMGGSPTLYAAGAAAFSAIMAALWQRDASGMGQYIDCSIQEATATTQIHASIEATWQGTDTERAGSELIEAADGWVSAGLEVGVSAETWPKVCAVLDRLDLVDDPRFSTAGARREHRDELNTVVSTWARGRPKEEIYHQLQGLRSIAGYVATSADCYRSPQLLERGFFQQIDHPVAGPARYPGPAFRIGAEDWVTGRAPLLGEHNREVYATGLGYSDEELGRLQEKGVI